MAEPEFRPALIIVDVQEDFCPPNGSLAIADARSILPTINHLLALPFTLKIATKDWHPPAHISFASSHPSAVPFTSTTTITTAVGSYTTRLWPDHCIQGTPGACLLPDLDTAKLDHIIEKGQDQDVEMYSAFFDPHRTIDSGIAGLLRENGISDCYVVGLAFGFCVKETAVDAQGEGFRTVVIKEGTRGGGPEMCDWEGVVGELEEKGVRVVGVDGEEVGRVGKGV